MRRIWWGVPLLCVLACQQQEKEAPPISFYMQVARPAVEGQVTLNAQLGEVPRDGSFLLRVFQGETEVLTRPASLVAPITFAADAGDYTARLELLRGDEVVDSRSVDFRVFPVMPVTRRYPRTCPRLTPLDDAADSIDCSDLYEGARLWMDSRIVHTAAGRMTWVLQNGELVAQTPRGDSNAVEFPDGNWLATSDIAISGSTIARLWVRTLTLYELDQRGHSAPLAIASHDGRYAVLYGPDVPQDINGLASPYSLCALEPFSTRWEVGDCTTVNGIYLRQDARDGRVLFSTDGRLTWFDLTDPEHPTVVRTQVFDERFTRGGWILKDGSNAMVTVGRSDNLDCVATARADWSERLPDGGVSPDYDVTANASSELVWFTSQHLHETIWAPLP